MLVLDFPQNSPEWYEARRGIPTASEASSLITPKTAKLSASADRYIAELIAETVTTEDEWQGNQWTERGKEIEPEARAWYAFHNSVEVREVGLVLNKGAGWSPDGLIGDKGAIEAKCPKASTHVGWLLANELPWDHKPQVHAALHIGELDWIDFISYHPDFDPLVIRVTPDDYTKKLGEAFAQFIERLEAAKDQIFKVAA